MPRHRAPVGSYGGEGSYELGTPVVAEVSKTLGGWAGSTTTVTLGGELSEEDGAYENLHLEIIDGLGPPRRQSVSDRASERVSE